MANRQRDVDLRFAQFSAHSLLCDWLFGWVVVWLCGCVVGWVVALPILKFGIGGRRLGKQARQLVNQERHYLNVSGRCK